MIFNSQFIDYSKTGYFSAMVEDYLAGSKKLQPFYQYPVSVEGVQSAIAQRKKYPTNRSVLVQQLKRQYENILTNEKVKNNIDQLLSDNTFTITTAHQPNIFTGPLYFIYKIVHAIKLADYLNTSIPNTQFVPVYYMGSEDADLEELGYVYINREKYEWKTSQTGAVGRMKVDDHLLQLIELIAGQMSVQPFGKEIMDVIRNCYQKNETIEQATFKLVNALFAEYGLVIVLPDNIALKRLFISVMEKELTEQFSHKAVRETLQHFPAEYKMQANGRELNLFYLKDNIRERIEKNEDQYVIINDHSVKLSKEEMIAELKNHPERFSPNVILRPVFQEMILPNVAFIGGGGEIAYWLELKKVFGAVDVPYPVLVLRNSFMLIQKEIKQLIDKLAIPIPDLFKTEFELLNGIVKRNSNLQLDLTKEKNELQLLYRQLQTVAGKIDTTLQKHTEALQTRALHKIEILEKKMLRAEKRKFEVQKRQLHKIKTQLFPNNNLQERTDNLMWYYALFGKELIAALYENSKALEQEFGVLVEG